METAVSVVGLLVSSTGSALLRKVLFQLEGVGIGHTVHAFLKPWFTTWESLAACAVSLLILSLQQAWSHLQQRLESRRSRAGGTDVEQPLLDPFSSKELQLKAEQGPPVADITWGDLARLLVPATCSVFQIIVQGLGLAYISASTSMVLGGSAILFTAALSTTLLKCRLGKLHWAGIFLVLFGVTIVAVANIVWPLPELRPGLNASPLPFAALQSSISRVLFSELPDSVYNMIMGVSLTLLSQLLLAGQLVAEEWLLRSSVLHPLQVLGYEGLLGTIMVTIAGVPLTTYLPGTDQGGMLENWADSFAMVWRTPSVGIVNAIFFASVIGLNVFGVAVTRALGSVFRAVLLTARTALVWVVNVALWEMHVGGGKVGEAWAYPTSQLQLIGFALVLLGTVIYAQGSSHVAVQYRAAKNAAQTDDPSVHPATVSHATAQVTRLHAYTSVLIPPTLPAALLRQPGQGPLRPRLSAPPGASRTLDKGWVTSSSFPATNLARASAPARSVVPVANRLTPLPTISGSGGIDDLPHPSNAAGSAMTQEQNGNIGSGPDSPRTRPVMTQPGMTHQGPPALARPSFINKLTHRSSWIMPVSHRLAPDGSLLSQSRFASGASTADTSSRGAQLPEASRAASWRHSEDDAPGPSSQVLPLTNGPHEGGYQGPEMATPFAGPGSSSPGQRAGRAGNAQGFGSRPGSAESALSHLLANAPATLSGNPPLMQQGSSQDSPRANLSSSGSSPVAINTTRSFPGAVNRQHASDGAEAQSGQALSRGKISPMGQSPTPDLLIERRVSRQVPFHPLPSHIEGCSSDDEDDMPESAEAEASSQPQEGAGPSSQGEEQSSDAAAHEASSSAVQSESAGPRSSGHSQPASGSGLAMLLGDPSPRSVSNQTFNQMLVRSRSNTPGAVTPGTPMTPAGQRVVTAATHAGESRAVKAGLAGLLGEGPLGGLGAPRAGRPPSLAAVAEKLQTSAAREGESAPKAPES